MSAVAICTFEALTIARLFNNLQIPDLDTRYCKVWNLKLDRDGCTLVEFL
jgi:hypothetical protein